MDQRGIPFTSLRRRRRPSTANAKGRKRTVIQRKRPQSSIGKRSSPRSIQSIDSSVLPWKRKRCSSAGNPGDIRKKGTTAKGSRTKLDPVISKRPWTSDSYRANHHTRRLNRAMTHSLLSSSITSLPIEIDSQSSSICSLGSISYTPYQQPRSSSLKRRRRRGVEEEMSMMSNSVNQTRTNFDTVPDLINRKKMLSNKNKIMLNPSDLFWTPSKDITASNLYFEGGIFQSLDVWGRLRLTEAQQVNESVKRSDSSYHSRIAADTMLRVTRPCLIDHGLPSSFIHRMIKGLLRGTFGLPIHTIRNEYERQTTATTDQQSISDMLTSPSWIQAAIPLLELQAYEEQFLPQMEGWREVQAKNRVMEINGKRLTENLFGLLE